MQNDTVNLALISVVTVGLLFFGARGIRKRGRAFAKKELADAHLILSIGEFAAGFIGFGYLVYMFWRTRL